MQAELKPGKSGQYEVQVDGHKVAEKTFLHGFPTEDEVVHAVAMATGKA